MLRSPLLKRLRWPVKRRLGNRVGGTERSTLRGPGPELAELREYVPGDDVRSIDWHVTARAEKTFVRLAEVERGLDVLLVVDLSRSVDWGTTLCHRRERAIDLCAAAADLLLRQGNRVGLLPFADEPLRASPPRGGQRQLVHVLETLKRDPGQAGDGPTGLREALERANALMPRRGLLLVVSDFIAPEGWQGALGRLAARHEVVAVHLADPRDGALPDIGVVTFEDPETGRQLTIDTGDGRLRERFSQAAVEQLATLRRELAGRGVDLLELTTAEPILPALLRFLELRRIHAQGGSARGERPRTCAPQRAPVQQPLLHDQDPDLPPAS